MKGLVVMAQETLYSILGIPGNALPDEISNAFRRQAMKWHPDHRTTREQQADEVFRRIAAAFKVLSSQKERAVYDRSLNLAARRFRLTAKPQTLPSLPDISWEEAENLFSGQLLDLASDLAARGYDEKTLARALTALGCPARLALSTSSLALKQVALKCEKKRLESAHLTVLLSKRAEPDIPSQMSFKFAMADGYDPSKLPEIRPSLFARW